MNRLKNIAFVLLFTLFVFGQSHLVFADAFDDRLGELSLELEGITEQALSDTTDPQVSLKLYMTERQVDVANSYLSAKERVSALAANDAKKSDAGRYLKNAEGPRDAFLELVAADHIDTDLMQADEVFNNKEAEAINAINEVNRYILSPTRPGAVPQGDLVEDFIPGIIRILFRFASLAVLLSFVVSGVMLVMAFSNEERISKAKSMLYYSLIGFAFVTLAFAIIKAVTDIDFFGFI